MAYGGRADVRVGTQLRLLLVVVGLLLFAGATHIARASLLPAGFSDTLVSRPDGRPWDEAAGIVFADDGRMFVWERGGRVWIANDRSTGTVPIIDLSDEVSTIGSLGLSGFALDPRFISNGYIYLYYAVEPQHLANCAAPASGPPMCGISYRAGQHEASGATIGRLVRYQLSRPRGASDYRTATAVDYASRRVLVGETRDTDGAQIGCVVTDSAHGPGGLAFGSDGTLLAGCGDGADASAEDSGSDPTTQYQSALAMGLMTPAENVGAFRAQLVDSLSGKILRLDPATGNGVIGNPFYDPATPRTARSRVWVLGLHDPQHFSVRPGSGSGSVADGRPGTLYIGDTGGSNWESLAVAIQGRMNFGWPLYEGVGNDTTGYASLPGFNLDAPNPDFPSVCQQQYFRFRDLISPDVLRASWPNPCQPSVAVPATDDVFARDRPAIDWSHLGADARWAAFDDADEPLALTLGAQAPTGALVGGPLFSGADSIGGVWYQGSRFPAPFDNVYFHADAVGQWIKAFSFDANDFPVVVRDFLANGGTIRALAADARTGALLYVSGPRGSEVHKVSYSATASVSAPAVSNSAVPLQLSSTTNAAVTPAPTITRQVTVTSKAMASTTSPGWSSNDIGSVAAAGSYTLNGSTYTVKGSGADIWGAADAFQFVSQPFTGDGSITARVVSQTDTNGWAKAGVMFRETLAAGSTYAFTMITPGFGAVFQMRAAGNDSSISGPPAGTPYWVRVVRAGNVFSSYVSPDGNTWSLIDQATITMASQAYVGLAVSSHADGVLSTVVFDNVTISAASTVPDTQAPTVPAGLTSTTITANSISLSWTASTDLPNPGGSGVGGYYLYRNGNTTTPIATISSGTSYTDTGLAASTPYSYQVAAFDEATPPNVSALSAAINVTTQSGSTTSPGWSSNDIGSVAAAGSYTLNGSTYTVKGSGADIWGAADAFQFVSQPFTGDGSITARVVSQTDTNGWAKAGVMFRETLAAGSTYAFTMITPGFGAVFQMRAAGNDSSISGPPAGTPYWVRVVRAGNVFSSYVSPDGNTWSLIDQATITMASQAYVGLAVSSHADGVLSTVVFDNVTISAASTVPDTQAPTVPAGLTSTTITANSISLSWTASTDLPNPGGSGVGGYYLYRNGNTTTPIATISSGTSYTDTGLAASTPYSYQVAAFDEATPPNVSALSAAINVTTQSGSTTSPGWSSNDIGSVAAAGSYTLNGSTYTVKGSGADIWGAADAFQFVSQPFTGDGSITARVVSQTDTNGWAKAGVMFRETLAAGSTYAFTMITPGFGAVFQMRAAGNDSSISGPPAGTPYWVRVVRAGNVFSSYVSPDGNTWSLIDQATITMASQAYVGLAVSSHADGVLSTVVFDNVTISAASTVPDTQAPTVPAGLTSTTITANSISLSWTASTDLPNPGGSGVGGYYLYRNGNTTTPIATISSGTSYTDTGLAASTPYSYQVAAFDEATPPNVSALSAAINVTTQSGSTTSPGWSSNDIGSVAAAGSYTLNGSTYTVKGSGADIWGAADAFQFVSQPFTGDGSITARVVSQTDTNGWAKAGVMFRETLAAGSTYAFTMITPGFGAVFQMRAAGNDSSISGPPAGTPYWVRVVRAGNVFSSYVSPDGNTWSLIDQATITMASQAYVGLAVSSHADGVLSTVVFDNVTISAASTVPDTQAPTVPAGLTSTTITANSISLSWTASTDLPNPGGSGVGGYYLYRNGNTTTPIATISSGTSYTDTGLAASTPYSYQVAAFDEATPPNVSALSAAINVTTQSGVASGLAVTPSVAGLTPSQSQQFTAAVAAGDSARWTVDGVAGGNSVVGAITTNGLYSPGSAAGTHAIVATSVANPSLAGSAIAAVTKLAGVYTYHDDIFRDGANSQEYALTPATVNTASFGKLFSCGVDGAVYAQPLWVGNLLVNGAMHNVVLVATAHDSLYAFDADTSPCVPLWQVSLIDTSHGATSGEITIPAGTTGHLVGVGYGDITPEVGVTGTPVIDPATGILYVVSKSMNSAGTNFYSRLHAIDVTTGNEKIGSPIAVGGQSPGTGDGASTDTFNVRQEAQRAGLAFVNGVVYIAWASHEDATPYYGWITAYQYNGASFMQTAIINVSPNQYQSGIWMGGGAPAADSSNNLYVLTGNGLFDASNVNPGLPSNDYGDSLLQLTAGLAVSQYFTPTDQQADADADHDFGSGGPAVLADLPNSTVPHILLAGGKDGNLYVFNRDSLGGYGDGHAAQIIPGRGIFATGAYWNNTYFIAGAGGGLTAYQVNTSTSQFTQVAVSAGTYGWPGGSPVVSAAGSSAGIVWGLDTSHYCTNQSKACGPALLHAYDATNVANELWNSSMVPADAAGNAVKFAVPTVANGKVYIGTRGNNMGGALGSTTISGELDVYGLKPN